MSEFKGTPGKWFQSHRKIPNDPKGMYSTQVYTEDGETIASIHWYPKPPEKVIFEGKPATKRSSYRNENALLISKAPELLEALKELLDITSQFSHPKIDWIRGNARNLIKEATELNE